MEDVMDIAGGLFEAQLTQAMLIWLIVAGIMILFGMFMLAVPMIYRFKGQAVSLRVIAVHHDVYKPKADDTAEKIARKSVNPRIRPEFEILDGTYAGRAVVSSSASSNDDHVIGETVMGHYIEQSGELASERQFKSSRNFGLVFLAIGLGIIVFAIFMSL